MKYRRKLFMSKDIYDLPSTDDTFVRAMQENVAFHMRNCADYKNILSNLAFDPNSIRNMEDLAKIPPLPTAHLKNHSLLSRSYHSLLIKTTSSGTGGEKTFSGFDASSALCEFLMAWKVWRFHKMFSPQRTNYIILGAQPNKTNQTAMAKALRGIMLLAPAKKTQYALIFKNGEYEIDIEGLIDAIVAFGKQNRPVRIIGFPAYLKMFLDELHRRTIKMQLHENSKIMVGGGWKAFFSDAVSKDELIGMASHTLGIRRENFKDQFSTAEHPITYVSCANNHFHVPIFGRVIIRDVRTLQPVPMGTPGLLNLVTPLLSSVPYGSILTDDIAVMKDGGECGCGVTSPYFELIGRVGLKSIKTCAQAASEFLNKV